MSDFGALVCGYYSSIFVHLHEANEEPMSEEIERECESLARLDVAEPHVPVESFSSAVVLIQAIVDICQHHFA